VPARTYNNRLADLWVGATRHVNALGSGDVLWIPGQNR
jgi:hypothetical protein